MLKSIYLSFVIRANSISTITLNDSRFLALVNNNATSIFYRFQEANSCPYNFSCHIYKLFNNSSLVGKTLCSSTQFPSHK